MMQRIIRGLACVQALRRGRGVLLGFLDGIGRRSCGDAALPLDQVHNVERDDGDKAAEDDRHHEPQRAAVGQELPDDEGNGAGEDGELIYNEDGNFLTKEMTPTEYAMNRKILEQAKAK